MSPSAHRNSPNTPDLKGDGEPRASANRRAVPIISARTQFGQIVEIVFGPEEKKTRFVVWNNREWAFADYFQHDGRKLIPYSANNNLIQHDVILLPREPEEYGSTEELFAVVKAFLHRYVDVSPIFEDIAASYILLSWVFDSFDELPYLRLRGDPGSGKTRCLLTIGSICYKPIFASGASTVSPVFRLLDSVRGTLVLDEGDFRFTDEKAEIIKILNNGNAKGFPVLRSEQINKQEFDPRAYHVYGPKVLATRGHFRDHALETRCLTEEMGQRRMRHDIPLNLPEEFAAEALSLRNRLLLYRFRYLSNLVESREPNIDVEGRKLEPRMQQLLVPLLRVTPSEKTRREILQFAEGYQIDLLTDRGMDTEAQVIEVLFDMAKTNPSKIVIGDLTDAFTARFANDYERKITPKWIGSIVRRKLGLKTYKSAGTFIIPDKELSKLTHLAGKYGIDLNDMNIKDDDRSGDKLMKT